MKLLNNTTTNGAKEALSRASKSTPQNLTTTHLVTFLTHTKSPHIPTL